MFKFDRVLIVLLVVIIGMVILVTKSVKMHNSEMDFVEKHCKNTMYYSFNKHNTIKRVIKCDEVYKEKDATTDY